MPSWVKLEELGAKIAEKLPGLWDQTQGPSAWMTVLTRSDSMVRIFIDDNMLIMVESAIDIPLPPMGDIKTRRSTVLTFKTKIRNPDKIASLLVKQVPALKDSEK